MSIPFDITYSGLVLNYGEYETVNGTADNTTINNGATLEVYKGTANNTTINGGGIMGVLSGGKAFDTTVNGVDPELLESGAEQIEGGFLNLYFEGYGGGTATRTTVNSGGSVRVGEDSILNSATIKAGAAVKLWPGGKATGSITIENGATFSAEDGAIIDFNLSDVSPENDALVNDLSLVQGAPGFTLTVSGTLDEGTYKLAEGAAGFDKTITVVNTLGETLGTLTVEDDRKLIDGGKYTLNLDDSSGLSVTISDRIDLTGDLDSEFHLEDGMYGSSVNVLSGGALYISSGAEADHVTVNFGGYIQFWDASGTMTNIKENGGYANTHPDATVTFLPNSFGGYTYSGNSMASIHSGTIGSGLTVCSDGGINVFSGGVAQNVTAGSRGEVSIRSGGTVDGITISSGGRLEVLSGGKVTGKLTLYDRGVFSTELGSILDFDLTRAAPGEDVLVNDLSGRQIMSSLTLTVDGTEATGDYNLVGQVSYYSFETRTITVVNTLGETLGTLTVAEGTKTIGSRDYTLTIDSGKFGVTISDRVDLTGDLSGEFELDEGKVGSSVNILNGGNLRVSDGGSAEIITVNPGGTLYVSDGGSATGIVAEEGALLGVTAAPNTHAQGTYAGSAFEITDTANGFTVQNGGALFVSYGGFANDTTVKSASLLQIEGGTATGVAVASDGVVEMVSWGSVSGIAAEEGAICNFAVGPENYAQGTYAGSAFEIGNTVNGYTIHGELYVLDGGTADDVTVNPGCRLNVEEGGKATKVKENGGFVYADSDAEVSFVSNSFSGLHVSGMDVATVHSGTTATDTTLIDGGMVEVFTGGVLIDTTVNAGGRLFVTGGKLTGKTTIETGAKVTVGTGSILDFDLTQTAADADVLVNDLSFFRGYASYTLTVSGRETTGTYKLAGNAADFDDDITVVNTSGEALGTLTVDGGTQTLGGRDYTLTLTDGGALGVTVAGGINADTTPPEKPVPEASTKLPTNGYVTVTATFSDDSVLRECSKDGENWVEYTSNGLTFVENGKAYFRATDDAGNVSDIAVYEVTNIDKSAPTITNITPSTTEPVFSVTVTATFADDVAIASKLYRIGDGFWQDYPDDGVTVTQNGTVEFTAIDTAGNETTASYAVTNIKGPLFDFDLTQTAAGADALVSNLAPAIANNFSYRLIISGSESTGIYKLAGNAAGFNKTISVINTSGDELGTLEVGGDKIFTKSSSYTLVLVDDTLSVDVLSKSVQVDTTKPVISKVKANITTPTDGSVIVTADFSDDGVLVSKLYRIGDGDWQDYTDGVLVTANATVYFKATDAAGNVSDIASYEVTNIGGGSPAVDLTGDLDTEYNLTFGKVASSVNILSGGMLFVSNGAQASQTVIYPGGSMSVSSDGTATQITENGGYVNIGRREVTNGMFVPNEFSGIKLEDEWASLHSGTTATDTAIDPGGKIFVYSGGSAIRTTVNTYGGLYVCSGGSANKTTVNFGAQFFVSKGGTATQITENGGDVYVEDGATVTFVPNAFSGIGHADFIDRVTLHSGTTGTDLTFSAQNAGLDVYGGGVAKNIAFNTFTELKVHSGGSAEDIAIDTFACLDVYSGGKITGKMTFEIGATVTAEDGAILDFDLTQAAPGADALVNSLSPALVQPFTYTLTVDDTQAKGTYKLAGNAAGFNRTITVVNTSGDELGTLTVGGDKLPIGSASYALSLDADDTLAVDVVSEFVYVDTTAPVVSNVAVNITGPTLGRVTVTADFSDDVALASRQYKIGDGDWTDYTAGVTVTANTTVYFKAVDTSGNVSDIASYEVTNIIPPVAPDLSGDLNASCDLTVGMVGRDVNILDGGELNVSDGGTAENTTVNSGGELNVSSGGKLTGKTTFEAGAAVTAEDGAILDFDLTQLAPGEDALVNDLSSVKDQPFTYTLTVDNAQAMGTYTLAGGAEGFDKAITVKSIYGDTAGTLTVDGGATKLGDVYLKLEVSGSDLTFTISEYNVQNSPDNGTNDYLYRKNANPEWNDANISIENIIFGDCEIHLDKFGTVNKDDKHNLFGNNGTYKDTGDVAKIDVNTAAMLTFTIDSTEAGTFYVYEDGFDKRGRAQITVGKVTVKPGKPATLKDVCLTSTGSYYVAMTAKNVSKIGAEGLYNVRVTGHKFFRDADNNDNNTAKDNNFQALVERGTKSIFLDSGLMIDSTWCKNFVGFGDTADYIKIDLMSSAYLSFNLTGEGDGKAKFTIWKYDTVKKKMSKVGGVTTLNANNGYKATTKAQFLEAGGNYEYYISMECSDAAKGKGVYYNVAVTDDSVFFDSADNKKNNVLYDKKFKDFYAEDENHQFELTTIDGGTKPVKLDSAPVGNTSYENFVGYGDPADYAKITLSSDGNLSFDLKATGNATFVVYKKGEKNGKKTLDVIQKTKLTLKKGETDIEKSTALLTGLKAGDYYVSMTAKSTKANASGSVFYNVTATLTPQNPSSLAMPETDSAASSLAMPEADSLGISDALSFGGFNADVLADASASALADLDDKSGWLNIASLA